ncbi:hypothetical protein [Aquimarina sp. 2201CG14-23]|uniref:hypothetical protein n=1 Tax=Aquimarina mycalae TaxID=3040073 RepID=UPI0024781C9A|nr:hypothetical protein [Aquimarina sp. 2201CG14-23]MDH7444515.1 hypothetical protein [Aquimarina sp. 2201CG14-23]
MAKENKMIKFHLFDFKFTPLKEYESSNNSSSILKSCIDRINNERTQNNKAIVVDRNENRDSESRQLFVSSAAYRLKDKVYKCRIALIRDGKIPTLVDKKYYTLTSFDQLGSNSIAETTNFYIDMNSKVPIVCCEFHSQGPRISDIEYYFRYISSHNMLRLSKACKANIHMEMPINDVLTSISEVLKFKIKVRPQRLAYINDSVNAAFVGNMYALANTVDPNYIKVEASFRDFGNVAFKKNNKAKTFIKRTLNAINNDNQVGDDFDDFYLEFENNKGNFDTFSLISGKVELGVNCTYLSPGNLDTKELYNRIMVEFNRYLDSKK